MINLSCFLKIFCKKRVLVYIYDYANELICILEYVMKGHYLSFNFVPNLSLYVELKL